MIEIKDLSYKYPGSAMPVLKNINIQLPQEHFFAILGQSGSGKTTLLNCIAKFLKPTTGSITIEGKNIREMERKEFRSQLGVVFQRLNLFPHLTVARNLTLAPTKVLGKTETEALDEAHEMLARLAIAELAERYPAQISGGQAQRVAIARALMLQPKYMLLDEPTSALDAQTTGDFAAWLSELQSETCFIIVTHDLPFASMTASRGLILDAGEVISTGNIKEIVSQSTEAVT